MMDWTAECDPLSPRSRLTTRCASAFALFTSMRSRNLFHRTPKASHHSIFNMYDKIHHKTSKSSQVDPPKHVLRRTCRPTSVVSDYAAVSTQNSAYRKSMEDECVAVPQLNTFIGDQAQTCFFGVYDGHGGEFCAQYASKHFHLRLSAILAKRSLEFDSKKRYLSDPPCYRKTMILDDSALNCDVFSNETIEECYMETFAAIDSELATFDESAECGSTAVTCLVRRFDGRTTYHIANVGDSCAILSAHGKTTRLTVDHRATNEDEVRRIRESNGIIFNKRVAGVLSVTRALGQSGGKEFITAQPHVVSGEVDDKDSFIVLASDGVTDVYTDEELTSYISMHLKNGEKSVRICKHLLTEGKARGGMDNMTIVIVCF